MKKVACTGSCHYRT